MKQGVFLRSMVDAATEATVDIIGVIGWDVGFQQLRAVLASIPDTVNRIVFDIYSPGGDVWDGNAMISEIGALKQETVANVRVAASMATLIAVACKVRVMAANGRWLIHNPWTATQGDAAEMEKTAKELRDAQDEAAKFYALRTGKTVEEMTALMAEERWIKAEAAKAFGFIHEINDPFDATAFAPVRAEIEAAGRWPKALAEIPEEVPAHEDTKPADVPTAVTETPIAEPAPISADARELADAFNSGATDGRAQGYAHAAAEFGEQINALNARVVEAERLTREHQSERDKLAAKLAVALKSGEDRAAALRADLDAATEKLRSFISGSLTFHPAVETWEDAMRACNSDYATAAKQYPQLLEKYRAAQRQKGSK